MQLVNRKNSKRIWFKFKSWLKTTLAKKGVCLKEHFEVDKTIWVNDLELTLKKEADQEFFEIFGKNNFQNSGRNTGRNTGWKILKRYPHGWMKTDALLRQKQLFNIKIDYKIEVFPGPRIFPKNNGEKSVKSVWIKKLPPYFSA